MNYRRTIDVAVISILAIAAAMAIGANARAQSRAIDVDPNEVRAHDRQLYTEFVKKNPATAKSEMFSLIQSSYQYCDRMAGLEVKATGNFSAITRCDVIRHIRMENLNLLGR